MNRLSKMDLKEWLEKIEQLLESERLHEQEERRANQPQADSLENLPRTIR
jgi:hypothetical protein